MNNPDTAQFVLVLLVLGVGLGFTTIVLNVLSGMVVEAICWVDDEEQEGPYPLTKFAAWCARYKHEGGKSNDFHHASRKSQTSSDFTFAMFIGAIPLPCLFYFGYLFPWVPAGLGLLYCIAHTARFARRHKKLFDKHVKDPEAHK
ncbi:hypothetical protein HOS55_gp062 [Pseudomonas phage PMBT3]|uniref:Uncharacterized protein n=1 Tax=Pseudomonas phage PMBT3 TaxID=2059856 RepID=A0A2I6PHZ0_9CAUD|nr:hypothetical protein HOS55_gp062 [Pseudomonas phage PMBT3]AUM59664.1 hypothetical protein [Pseudomonas phage PMBT3]